MDTIPNNAFSKDELIKCGQGNLSGARVPVPLPGMLMLDRVVEINSQFGIHRKGEIVGELDIDPALWFFQCHFKDDPIMPGSLIVDALFQLVGIYLGWLGHQGKGRALGCGKISFKEEVLPGAEKLVYRVSIKKIRELGMNIAIADGAVLAQESLVCTAKSLTLGLK